ncbi:MAG: hypothetical protein EOP49_11265 [Sphingobacteriales bacterium]|nr:MAG: hypothetical protein EOP49_11265 [Sphingobacteriales bacterium]
MKCFFVLLAILSFQAFSASSQSADLEGHIVRHYGSKRPYIIFNNSSRDCISCRGALSNSLERLKQEHVDLRRVHIVSDNRLMELFYSKYEDIYKDVVKEYDKALSDALAVDGKNKAYLLSADTLEIFSLPLTNEALVRISRSINQNPDPQPANTYRLVNQVAIKDTLFERSQLSFSSSGRNIVAFNADFQIGLALKNGRPYYQEPKLSDATLSRLYELLGKYNKVKFQSIPETRKSHKLVTMPAAFVHEYSMEGDACYVAFKFNSCFEEPETDDSTIRIGVMGQYFVGKFDLGKTTDVLDISNCKSYSWLDSVGYGGLFYYPEINYPILIDEDTILVRVMGSDSNGNPVDTNGISYASMLLVPGKKARLLNLYRRSDVQTSDYIVGRDGSGHPVLFDQQTKSFTFLNKEKGSLAMDNLGSFDSIKRLLDFYISGDEITMVGTTNDDRQFTAVLTLDGKCQIENLVSDTKVQGARFGGADLYTFSNNPIKRELTFNRYSKAVRRSN